VRAISDPPCVISHCLEHKVPKSNGRPSEIDPKQTGSVLASKRETAPVAAKYSFLENECLNQERVQTILPSEHVTDLLHASFI